MKHRLHDVRYLVQLAVLTALLLLLEITGLGYIKTPVLEFTVMQVPVILGAIILGPGAGALLGGVFGLTSFWECFGKSAFGMQASAVASTNPQSHSRSQNARSFRCACVLGRLQCRRRSSNSGKQSAAHGALP